jgi:hypothetical protein
MGVFSLHFLLRNLHADLFGLSFLRLRQGNDEQPIVILRLHVGIVHLKRKLDGADKLAARPLAAVKGLWRDLPGSACFSPERVSLLPATLSSLVHKFGNVFF